MQLLTSIGRIDGEELQVEFAIDYLSEQLNQEVASFHHMIEKNLHDHVHHHIKSIDSLCNEIMYIKAYGAKAHSQHEQYALKV